MEHIIVLSILFATIIIYKLVFKINIKKAKELKDNKKLEKITDKFPDNVEIAKEMLEMLGNKKAKIEQKNDTQTSLYVAITNKITIADFRGNYARIQTIAHECIHSCQDRTLLLFNFIFSNINLLYFLIASILTITGIFKHSLLHIFILTIFLLISFSIRGFLETEAMTKAKFLAKEYMLKKQLCTEDEIDKLVSEYDKINKIGIPFVLDNLVTTGLIKIIIYTIIAMII